jgi:hypothetical protein
MFIQSTFEKSGCQDGRNFSEILNALADFAHKIDVDTPSISKNDAYRATTIQSDYAIESSAEQYCSLDQQHERFSWFLPTGISTETGTSSMKEFCISIFPILFAIAAMSCVNAWSVLVLSFADASMNTMSCCAA